MSKGIHEDFRKRLAMAKEDKTCLIAQTENEAQRLRAAARRGTIITPVPQVYALPDVWSELKPRARQEQIVRALATLHPGWVFAGPSAAVVHGLEVPYDLLNRIYVATSAKAHSRDSAWLSRQVIKDDAFTCIDGVRVTSLQRTVFDSIRLTNFRYGLAIADSALRVYKLPKDQMMGLIDAFDGRCHDKQYVLDVMEWADGRSENGGESVVRAIMIEQGFVLPALQVDVMHASLGMDEYRVDYYWHLPYGDVIGELDGHDKYTDPLMTHGMDTPGVMAKERRRESRLTGVGAKVMRFSYFDALNVNKFRHLLMSFGIPQGAQIPAVACR